jgi:hypothetical protein
MEKKVYFLRERPGLDQDPRLLGYRSEIPDRTLDVCILTEHRRKAAEKRRQTDDITISLEHCF